MPIAIDILVCGILGWFFYVGYKKGFVSQLFQLLGLFVAFVLTTPISRKLTQIMMESVELDVQLLSLLFAILAYTVIYLVFYMLGSAFGNKANESMISLPNKLFGAVFGALKGVFVLSLLIVFIRLYPVADEWLCKQINLESSNQVGIVESNGINDPSDNLNNEIDSLATESSDIEPYDVADDGFKKDEPRRSEFLYLSYKVSQITDPFITDFKQFFYERKGKALESIKNINLPGASLFSDDDSTDSTNADDSKKKKKDPTLEQLESLK